MKSISIVLETVEDVRQGYGLMGDVPQKVIWDTIVKAIPTNHKYKNYIRDDIFVPYIPEVKEFAQSPTLNQINEYIKGKIERTLTIYYE